MILYKALKYFILDVCLDKLFYGLANNLNFSDTKRIYLEDLVAGTELKRIEFHREIYFNCRILRIRQIPRPVGAYGPDVLYLLKFKCSAATLLWDDAANEIEMALRGNEDIGLYI
jgi:hypothetical protein